MKIKNIAIVGGTHGNEYTGIFLLKQLENINIKKIWPDLNINTILANPKAYDKCVRYIDHDLNRAFLIKDLENKKLCGYEFDRAKEINKNIGPKGQSKTDFIIDVHTTTSNMGVTLIFYEREDAIEEFRYRLASYIMTKVANVSILSVPSKRNNLDHPFLDTIAPIGITLEAGPIPNGVVRHEILQTVNDTINATLSFIQQMNLNNNIPLGSDVEYFSPLIPIKYPKDEKGKNSAWIHKNIQDKDFKLLKKGTPIFFSFDGIDILFEGYENKDVYPVFVNEAAYYKRDIAFYLTEKRVRIIKNKPEI